MLEPGAVLCAGSQHFAILVVNVDGHIPWRHFGKGPKEVPRDCRKAHARPWLDSEPAAIPAVTNFVILTVLQPFSREYSRSSITILVM